MFYSLISGFKLWMFEEKNLITSNCWKVQKNHSCIYFVQKKIKFRRMNMFFNSKLSDFFPNFWRKKNITITD